MRCALVYFLGRMRTRAIQLWLHFEQLDERVVETTLVVFLAYLELVASKSSGDSRDSLLLALRIMDPSAAVGENTLHQESIR